MIIKRHALLCIIITTCIIPCKALTSITKISTGNNYEPGYIESLNALSRSLGIQLKLEDDTLLYCSTSSKCFKTEGFMWKISNQDYVDQIYSVINDSLQYYIAIELTEDVVGSYRLLIYDVKQRQLFISALFNREECESFLINWQDFDAINLYIEIYYPTLYKTEKIPLEISEGSVY